MGELDVGSAEVDAKGGGHGCLNVPFSSRRRARWTTIFFPNLSYKAIRGDGSMDERRRKAAAMRLGRGLAAVGLLWPIPAAHATTRSGKKAILAPADIDSRLASLPRSVETAPDRKETLDRDAR